MKDKKGNFNYLEERPDKIIKKIGRNGQVTQINRIFTDGISLENKRLLAKSKVTHKNVRDWNSEYREHMIYKIIYALVNPFPPKISELADRLGIEKIIIQKLIKTSEYLEIKSKLRKDLRDRWSADIDQVLIRKSLMGSKYHMDLFYKLQGELVDKLEVTKKNDIPETEEERLKLISKMNKELGFDVKDLIHSASVKKN